MFPRAPNGAFYMFAKAARPVSLVLNKLEVCKMKRLKAEDIIDLEIYAHADGRESEDYKVARDFKIYSEADALARRSEMSLLAHWIRSMRKIRGGRSAGSVAALCFKLFSVALFLAGAALVGAPLAHAVFVEVGQGGLLNVSYFFFTCVLLPFLLLVSAVFLAPLLGELVDMAVSAVLARFFSGSGGLRALYSSNRKWLMLKGAICAQYLGIGVAAGIFCTQLARPMFNGYEYGWRTTLPQYVTAGRVHAFVKAVALPWSPFAGEGVGYPSLKQVEDSRISPSGDAPSVENPDARYEVWSVFFILSSFTYGLLLRVLALLYYKFRISRSFGVHRIRNDRRVSDIMRRMAYSSRDLSGEPAGVSEAAGSDTVIVLRRDLDPWRETIAGGVKGLLGVRSADDFGYDFGRELFGCDFEAAVRGKKNIAFVYLSDDYNAEVFETLEALVDKFPEKFVSVHLLGRLSKKDGVFHAPPPVEKSWWERKINSVSSRNLRLF